GPCAVNNFADVFLRLPELFPERSYSQCKTSSDESRVIISGGFLAISVADSWQARPPIIRREQCHQDNFGVAAPVLFPKNVRAFFQIFCKRTARPVVTLTSQWG